MKKNLIENEIRKMQSLISYKVGQPITEEEKKESKLLDFYAEEQSRKDRCVDHKAYIESFGGLKWK